jgi:hypothetical protein
MLKVQLLFHMYSFVDSADQSSTKGRLRLWHIVGKSQKSTQYSLMARELQHQSQLLREEMVEHRVETDGVISRRSDRQF